MKELNELIEMPDKPLTKRNLKEKIDTIITEWLNEGFVDEAELFFKLRYAQEALDSATKSDNLKFAVTELIANNGNELIYKDVMKLTKVQGADKYDFSPDPVWRAERLALLDAQANLKVISDRIKIREQFLSQMVKNGAGQILDDNGEVIPKPKLISGGGEIIKLNF